MSNDEIALLASDELQKFITSHTQDDEKKILLARKTIFGVRSQLIAQQISGRRKAASKLPLFYNTKGIIYPPSLNIEQSSSEATAKFKTGIILKEIVKENLLAADLTGGFGVDSFFFGKMVNHLEFIEPSQELMDIVKHNCDCLLQKNISFNNLTAESFLDASSANYDFIFADPSRRDTSARKVFSFSDCSPNVVNLLPEIFKRTLLVLIKSSPLLDIKKGLGDLAHAKKVFVVSVENETKELLFLLEKGFSGDVAVETFNLMANGSIKHSFHFNFSDEDSASPVFSEPREYLYEPNSSILKAGAFKIVADRFRMSKIHINTHYYTSAEFREDFPGRIFRIDQVGINSKSLEDKKANVTTRNYPLTAQQLKKKLRLTDGGEKYVIGFTGKSKKYVVLATRLA